MLALMSFVRTVCLIEREASAQGADHDIGRTIHGKRSESTAARATHIHTGIWQWFFIINVIIYKINFSILSC